MLELLALFQENFAMLKIYYGIKLSKLLSVKYQGHCLVCRHSINVNPLSYPPVIVINKACCQSRMLVADDCNPRYLGGRGQKYDSGLKPAQEIVLVTLSQK
jgi:hypothetical protein